MPITLADTECLSVDNGTAQIITVRAPSHEMEM